MFAGITDKAAPRAGISQLRHTSFQVSSTKHLRPYSLTMTAKPVTRLFVTADLRLGVPVQLADGQAHQLRHVLRCRAGDLVALFNGRDGEWAARLELAGRHEAVAFCLAQRRPQAPGDDLWLVFAPVKRARIDFLVEKATELGVSELHPVMTRHTAVERLNLARLAANTVEAAEQSERLTVPVLHAARPLEQVLAEWPAGRRLIVCDESGTAPPIAKALADLPPSSLALLVGPEGGLAETELDALGKLPFVCRVGLGPLVLRSDTAALAGLAVVQASMGSWNVARSR
jgi:16S rRNA (uracil1498-N3)-methyltransferase